jgi:tetratricopeptide (TPR) repeat protein
VFDPQTLLERGWQAERDLQPDEARDLFAQAVAEARWVAKPLLLVRALMALGETEHRLQHLARALDSYVEATSVCQKYGNLIGQAAAMLKAAGVLNEQKKPAEAEAAFAHSLELCRTAADAPPLPQARALHGLALLKEPTAPEEAVLLWQAATSLYDAAGESELKAECKRHAAFLMGC